MSELDDLEIEALAFSYSIANTPSSFRRSLMNNASVNRMANFGTEEEILDCLKDQLDSSPGTETGLGVAYAYLAALIKKRRQKGLVGEMPTSAKKLEWATYFWEIEESSQSTTTYSHTGSELPISKFADVKNESKSSSSIIIVRG